MSLIVFLLGRPGSGKSSIAKQIRYTLRENAWNIEYLYDYKLLQERFQQEIDDNVPLQKRKFRPRGPEYKHGFDVTDFMILDEVLKDLANKADSIRKDASSNEKKLLLIEFARNNYRNALSLFRDTLFQDAHILYIDASLETCIKRIGQRVDNRTQYDHFVSDDIMMRYYYKDDWEDGQCQQYLKSLEESGIRTYPYTISNTGTLNKLFEQVNSFIETQLLRETETTIPAVSKMLSQVEPTK